MSESPVEDVGGAVLFGVDGTLMDTVYLHTVAWAEALRQRGRLVPAALVHRNIGMGTDALLDALLGTDRDRGGDAALSAAHDTLYAQYWSRVVPLPGAHDLVRACAVRGWQVVLASSATRGEAEVMVRALGAGDVIAAVATSADVPPGEPAPDVVRLALAKAGVPAERALFVGAAAWDGQAAAKAGVRCLGVLTGGWTRHELHEAGMDAVYDSPAELLARLDDSLLAAPPGWA
ncbi:HAD family hydrolase [Streptomyces cocklensis]|nr:HAD family hydrolase [Actinacidiphila cocklensis]MDD1062092.1 HAD family hydrolase [Actinacidiphila cocklensis]WSX74501.1 HAD family hydrolase [Streptomyces sp. NBC_00899]